MAYVPILAKLIDT